MSSARTPAATRSTDVAVGAARLGIDAARALTEVVESMHATIARAPFAFGGAPAERTRGITGVVYQIIRATTRLVGAGLDHALPLLAPMVGEPSSSPRREMLLAALNGVIGDYLEASGNPLAIQMGWRAGGLLAPVPSGKVLVLVHGLCVNDLAWNREGHDHGEALAAALGYQPVYLRYNTGRHVSTNGRELAGRMEDLVDGWPVPVEELVILAHSMGGLVARSACHQAGVSGLRWLARLDRLIFLGTPHHGAALERAGNLVDLLLEVSPYAAPLVRIGGNRSAGINDLRFGNLLDEDWNRRPRRYRTDPRTPVPLPRGALCHAVAASRGRQAGDLAGRLLGDGLVSIASALGRHEDPRFALALPASHQFVAHGTSHVGLLSSSQVYRQLEAWLTASPARRRVTRPRSGAPSRRSRAR